MEVLIETIVSKVKGLSEDKLQAALEFVNFLDWQESDGNDKANLEKPATTNKKSTRAERLALDKVARGRFAHLPNSSEHFAQRKHQEIDLEDRRL